MSATSRRFTWLAAMTLGLWSIGVGGCGPTHTDLCERAAECGEGRDLEIEACIVDMDAREEEADIFSCGDEWGAYVDCLDSQGTCDAEHHSLAGCEGARESLHDCIGGRRAGHARIELVGAD